MNRKAFLNSPREPPSSYFSTANRFLPGMLVSPQLIGISAVDLPQIPLLFCFLVSTSLIFYKWVVKKVILVFPLLIGLARRIARLPKYLADRVKSKAWGWGACVPLQYDIAPSSLRSLLGIRALCLPNYLLYSKFFDWWNFVFFWNKSK